jgi:hypothetical protein
MRRVAALGRWLVRDADAAARDATAAAREGGGGGGAAEKALLLDDMAGYPGGQTP